MNIRRTAAVALSVAVLGAMSDSSASADEWNKLTYLTFSQDVAIPGKVLPAGTYTFRLVDSPSERHIVPIFNQTGTQLIATLLTVADQRLSPPDDTVIMFGEAAGNAPPPITAGFTRVTPLARNSSIRNRPLQCPGKPGSSLFCSTEHV